MRETPLLKLFEAAVPYTLPVRIYRRNIVAGKIEGGGFVKNGITGQCDLYGYRRGGLHIEIEGKSRNGKLSPEQEAWRDHCIDWDIPWLLIQVAPREQPNDTVSRWVYELTQYLTTRAAQP